MLLTFTSTHAPATDLGYLLHKHPERLHSRENSFGNIHIFYPEASEERCTCALLLEVDPVGLVRGRRNAAASRTVWTATSTTGLMSRRLFSVLQWGRFFARP
jgi:hypothetical protein